MQTLRSKTHCSTQVLEGNAVLAAIEQSLAMIEFDPNGNVLWANENFAKTMGYDVQELPGKRHRSFCLSAYANSSEYEKLWENLRSGHPFQEKIQRITKDGRALWFEATYTPVLDEEGSVQGILKVATDITAREHMTAQVTSQLQQMAETLLKRTEAGISSTQEIAAAIDHVVQVSEETMQTLRSLEAEADSVRGIIKSIREVASQTNLLALNAAIEAAHAGEHGRGFNVVATEVRKLSKQAEEATKEVNSSLSGMAQQVEKMSKGMSRTGDIIGESQHRVQKAVDEFQGIGEAARQLDSQAKELVDLL